MDSDRLKEEEDEKMSDDNEENTPRVGRPPSKDAIYDWKDVRVRENHLEMLDDIRARKSGRTHKIKNLTRLYEFLRNAYIKDLSDKGEDVNEEEVELEEVCLWIMDISEGG